MIWFLLLITAMVSIFQMHNQLKETFKSCCKNCGSCGGGCNGGCNNTAPYFQWMPMMFTMPAPAKCPEPVMVIAAEPELPVQVVPPVESAPSTPAAVAKPATAAPTTTKAPTPKSTSSTRPPTRSTTPLPGSKSGLRSSAMTFPTVAPIEPGKLDPNLRGTILAQIRAELIPLINQERACAGVVSLKRDEALDAAAQRLAEEIIVNDLRTDFPHFSHLSDTTVDERVKAEGWTGFTSAEGNLQQIIQYSKQLYDTNTPKAFIADAMCDNPVSLDANATSKILLNPNFNCIGIGYGLGNADSAKMNTKSCFVIVVGKNNKVVTQVAAKPMDCLNWELKSNCPDLAPPAASSTVNTGGAKATTLRPSA